MAAYRSLPSKPAKVGALCTGYDHYFYFGKKHENSRLFYYDLVVPYKYFV